MRSPGVALVPWCTTPIEAESSLGPDSHHPIISLSGIPSAVMVLRILHPILFHILPLSAFENAQREPRIREYRTIVDRDRELCTKASKYSRALTKRKCSS